MTAPQRSGLFLDEIIQPLPLTAAGFSRGRDGEKNTLADVEAGPCRVAVRAIRRRRRLVLHHPSTFRNVAKATFRAAHFCNAARTA